MARINIVDEVDNGKVVDVLKGGGIEVAPVFTTAFINSGTASAEIYAGSVLLHTVNVATTADGGQLMLGDADEASAISNDTSAGLVAKVELSKRGSYLFDTIISNKLTYRLTGLDCDGITVTYQIL